MSKNRRRIKLIQPRLQIRLIAAFLGISLLALLLQFILFASSLAELASDLPQDGLLLLERIPAHIVWIAVASFGVLLPLTFMVGVLVTFRIAGPIYRFEKFLGEIIRGENPPDCHLRKGDQLQELCRLLNQATAGVRGESGRQHAAAASSARDIERAA